MNTQLTPEIVLRYFIEQYGDTPVFVHQCADGRRKFVIMFSGEREVWVLYPAPDDGVPERDRRTSLIRCEEHFLKGSSWQAGTLREVPEALLQFVAGVRAVQPSEQK